MSMSDFISGDIAKKFDDVDINHPHAQDLISEDIIEMAEYALSQVTDMNVSNMIAKAIKELGERDPSIYDVPF